MTPRPQAGKRKARTCAWTLDDEDGSVWRTSCGRLWEFTTDGPKENGMKFCMECGKPVTITESPRKPR